MNKPATSSDGVRFASALPQHAAVTLGPAVLCTLLGAAEWSTEAAAGALPLCINVATCSALVTSAQPRNHSFQPSAGTTRSTARLAVPSGAEAGLGQAEPASSCHVWELSRQRSTAVAGCLTGAPPHSALPDSLLGVDSRLAVLRHRHHLPWSVPHDGWLVLQQCCPAPLNPRADVRG